MGSSARNRQVQTETGERQNGRERRERENRRGCLCGNALLILHWVSFRVRPISESSGVVRGVQGLH